MVLNSQKQKLLEEKKRKIKTINKHIKDLEFHRSLSGIAVFEVTFEENISNFSVIKLSYHKIVIH